MQISRCKEVRDRLGAYVDGDVPAAEHELIARHLRICAECRREEQALRRALEALKSSRPDGAPDSLLARFHAGLAEPQPVILRVPLMARTAVGLATALVLITLVWALPWRAPNHAPITTQRGPSTTAFRAADAGARAPRASSSVKSPRLRRRVASAAALNVVSPHRTEPEARSARLYRPKRHREPAHFLDVVPAVGPTARQQLAASAMAKEASEANMRSLTLEDGYIPVRQERVRVDHGMIEIRTAYRPGAGEFPSAVNVNVRAVRTPEVDRP